MIYQCCNEKRKAAVRNHPSLNGIDYLEVADKTQRTLLVYCLNPLAQIVTADNVMIVGGESVANITIDSVEQSSPPSNVLTVRTHEAGDFSTYCLRLVNSASHPASTPFDILQTLDGFDPMLAEASFSFKVECPPHFDCAPPASDCPPPTLTPPPINYLAKDYGSFRTIMLDRLNQLLPNWGGRNEADLGVALAELVSYVGDYLSYQQDAVATEAYLETARSRVSLRRHARLVDYTVHDGCNARTWIHVRVSTDVTMRKCETEKHYTRFYTPAPGLPVPVQGNEEAALRGGAQFFEPMNDASFYEEQNEMCFYTWQDTGCCLAKGATEATLFGSLPSLKVGDVLIFQEVAGPQTGVPGDADIQHRCAVMLTGVAQTQDPLTSPPTPVTEIQWSSDDALPFPLCLSSSYMNPDGDIVPVPGVSKAFGNVVLADHGLSVKNKSLGTVPQPRLYQPSNPGASRCNPQLATPIPVRFRLVVPDSPLTQAAPPLPTGASTSASALTNYDPASAVSVITLTDQTSTQWTAAQDLLESGEFVNAFVVEVDTDGTATLRFGDGANGAQPTTGTTFTADYRVGNGTAGNVGADSLTWLDSNDVLFASAVLCCRNPLPASGGVDPETNDQIRRRAPQAFLKQDRAVTPADYQTVTEMNPQVDRAAATLRWTGSWHTVFITVEPEGGGSLSPSLEKSLKKSVGAYRLAGQDLQFESPQYVSLQVALTVCVDPAYFNAHVQQALLAVLGSQTWPNGQTGLFYPDNFTFGQTVYLSQIYAAARTVPGVVSVTATAFQPQGVKTKQYLNTGEIPIGALQVARLDNDPSFPSHGQLTLKMQGGK